MIIRDDGEIDEDSLHGGCPTVHGIKWGNVEKITASPRFMRSTNFKVIKVISAIQGYSSALRPLFVDMIL